MEHKTIWYKLGVFTGQFGRVFGIFKLKPKFLGRFVSGLKPTHQVSSRYGFQAGQAVLGRF